MQLLILVFVSEHLYLMKKCLICSSRHTLTKLPNAMYCRKGASKWKGNHVDNVSEMTILEYLKLNCVLISFHCSEAFLFLFSIFFFHLATLETDDMGEEGELLLSFIQQTIGLITDIPIASMGHVTPNKNIPMRSRSMFKGYTGRFYHGVIIHSLP